MSDEFDRFLRNKLDAVREFDADAQARQDKQEAERKAEAERFAAALRDWADAREALRVLCEKVNIGLRSVDVAIEHADTEPGPDEIGAVQLRAYRHQQDTGHAALIRVSADGTQNVEYGKEGSTRQIALLPVAQCSGSGYEPFIMTFLDAVLTQQRRTPR